MPAYVYDKKKNELVKVAGNATNADLKDMNVYSTEEKIVGTWIDGKPIYRKVIGFNIGTTTQGAVQSIVIDNIPNISAIISTKGYIKWSNGTVSIPYVHMAGTNIDQMFTVFNRTDGAVVFSYFLTSTAYENQDAKVIVEYTKTTD